MIRPLAWMLAALAVPAQALACALPETVEISDRDAARLEALDPAQALACALPETVEISDRDAARLEALDPARLGAVAGALTAESAADRAVVAGIYAAPPVGIDTLPEGDYRCRTIKMGGLLPLVVYGWFACSITEGEEGLTLFKSTGSQRLSGTFYPTDTTLAFRGAGHYANEAPRAYDGSTDFDDVGCLWQAGGTEGRWILELPEPMLESDFDILEFARP